MKAGIVAKVIVIRKDGKVLLIRRTATDDRRPLQWDIPGGHVEHNETIEQAAVRETYEETGIGIEATQLTLGATDTMIVRDDLCMNWLFFSVHLNTAPEIRLDPHEHDTHTWLSPTAAIDALEYERQRHALKFVIDNELYQ